MKKISDLLKIMTVALLAGIVFTSCNTETKKEAVVAGEQEKVKTEAVTMNTLSAEEAEQGFVLLFDGKTTDGWRGYSKETLPSGWIIEDDALKCNSSGRGEAGAKDGGDIIYDKIYKNFHLKLDWKISSGGNSGIFYLGQETPDFDCIWKTAPEMQVLDNAEHPDAMLGKDGNRQAGSLYDLIPAVPQNAKPAGEWNSVEIICFKGTVIHFMNGEQVLEYHLWTPEWNELVAGSKFPGLNETWADVAAEGFIGLQDHGDDVWFRNIRIKEK